MNNQLDTLGDSQPRNEGLEDTVSQLAESAKEKLGEAVEPMTEKVIEVAEHQKDVGAEQIRVFAKAVHGAAGQLESEMPQFARYIHDAGQYLERAASDLGTSNPNELFNKLGKFGRNQPAAVFGGAVLAGFALTRFLKSSAHHPHQGSTAQGGSP